MSSVLVWVLILSSWDGGMLKVENIATWEDCERLRQRAEHAPSAKWQRGTLVGSCTQVSLLVPTAAAPTINVAPPTVNVAAPQVTVRPRITVKQP